MGQTVRNVCYCDITFLVRTHIFSNQLIQFHSSNAINLQHLTSHSTTCCPHNIEIVMWPQITMASLHPMY